MTEIEDPELINDPSPRIHCLRDVEIPSCDDIEGFDGRLEIRHAKTAKRQAIQKLTLPAVGLCSEDFVRTLPIS